MKAAILVSCAGLACCAAQASDPETVLTTYRVKAGKEAEFINVHRHTWQAIRRADLATPTPHVFLRASDANGKPFFTEVLNWRTHDAPEQITDEVRTLWSQLEALCEARDAHRGIEFPEMTIVDEPELPVR